MRQRDFARVGCLPGPCMRHDALQDLGCRSARPRGCPRFERIWKNIVRQYSCTGLSFTLAPSHGAPPRSARSIARFAAHHIALGNARRLGVEARDTTNIQAATVRFLRFKGLDGDPPESYWLVSFAFVNRRGPLEVRVDGHTGLVSMMDREAAR